MRIKKVYIVSNDTCPPFYWYSGVSRRSVQHVPPMLAGGGNFLIGMGNAKCHLKRSKAIHIMILFINANFLYV